MFLSKDGVNFKERRLLHRTVFTVTAIILMFMIPYLQTTSTPSMVVMTTILVGYYTLVMCYEPAYHKYEVKENRKLLESLQVESNNNK